MAKILDQYGKPIERAVLAEPQTSRLAWVRQEFADHPARGLTPASLHRILDAAERGDLAAQADVFLDMEERDAHIFSEMSKRKRALLTLDWSVVPPRGASRAEVNQAAQVQEWLQEIPDFEDLVLDALDGIGHGFAALEVQWQRLGSTWLPESVTHRPQRWFQTLPTDGNALRLRDGTMEGAEMWPFGWIVHRHRAKSGYLTRAGLHRVLSWPYLFKNYAVRDLAEFLEIYGLPMRVGRYDTGTSDEEKATLMAALVGIGHDAAGIIPKDMEIEFKEAAKGSHDPYQAMISWAERSVSKAVLGGTLTSQADGKSSTNALGQVHNEVRRDLITSDARQLAGTLDRDLIYPLLALNFGEIDRRRLPRLVFDTRVPQDIAVFSDALPKLVEAGVQVPVSWVAEKLAIPAPKEGEAVLTPPSMAAAATRRLIPGRLAALSAAMGSAEPVDDQAALDQALEALPADAIGAAMDKLLAPVIEAVRKGESYDEIADALLVAYPAMDEADITQLIANAQFAADVWGRLHANT